MIRARRLLHPSLLVLAAACGGGGSTPTAGGRPEPTSAEQTLTDLFNLTQLYQRMGRLAGGNPLPFVGSFAYFAGRGDSTIALLSVSLDNRALSFQRAGRDFAARYRVEVGFQKAGALPLRYAREEGVAVSTFQETQRADETILYQQAFLLPAGDYTASIVVRDPGGGTFSRAEAPIAIPSPRIGLILRCQHCHMIAIAMTDPINVPTGCMTSSTAWV